MRVYKLTDGNHQTRNQTQWGEGLTHIASGQGDLCGPGWLHAYLSPELAALFYPLHVAFNSPVLWEAEGEGKSKFDFDIKVGFTKLTTLHQVPLPLVTDQHRAQFAVLCARKVNQAPEFKSWAGCWLEASRSGSTENVPWLHVWRMFQAGPPESLARRVAVSAMALAISHPYFGAKSLDFHVVYLAKHLEPNLNLQTLILEVLQPVSEKD